MTGSNNGKWAGGVTVNEKGYRKITAGAHRNKYEHRRVMEVMLSDPVGLIFLPAVSVIPAWATVHHIDHDRQHNCTHNLMLVDKCIHNAISGSRQAYIMAHYEEWLALEVAQAERWE